MTTGARTDGTVDLSIVVPCYDSADTLQRTLDSLQGERSIALEVIVVDDGSRVPLDATALEWSGSGTLQVIRLERNRGKAGACNAGFARSGGRTVAVLDADDELVPGWDRVFQAVLRAWPDQSPLAFGWAVTESGVSTGSGRGLYTREEWLAGAGAGEYIPFFRGSVARRSGYAVIGCRKICGTLSYARILEAGPLYVHPVVLRIYHTGVERSISKRPFERGKALDSLICFQELRRYVETYDLARGGTRPPYLAPLYFREALYRRFGESRRSSLGFAWRERRRMGVGRLGAVALIAVLPAVIVEGLVGLAKQARLLRRFG